MRWDTGHGGAWTAAFTLDSSAPAAFGIHLLKKHGIWLGPLMGAGLLYVAAHIAGVA